jgi:hypothetical protein
MDLDPGFAFQPTTELAPTTSQGTSTPAPSADLTPLKGLLGKWEGTGLNIIWRPLQLKLGDDHFLEINKTKETLEFAEIKGPIPNRGFLQGDLAMVGVHYLQQISDANLGNGLHIEPGVWLSVPLTTDPDVPASVVRLASIPHGTTIVAQGSASMVDQAPAIPAVTITPFRIGDPTQTNSFPEQDLNQQSNFRTNGAGLNGVDQGMLDNPNSILEPPKEKVVATTILQVSTLPTPILGGGTANTAFLQGAPPSAGPPPAGPNADAAQVTATFWLQTTEGSEQPDFLQYSQTVLLNFGPLSWPHVTVATLRRHHHLL